jgi:hypothetical protein
MSDGQRDERFEAFLEQEAPAYNRPPVEVPREAMWEVVARARAAARDRAPAVRPAAVPRPSSKVFRYAPWIGMAATLLIGIGLGRYAVERNRTTGAAGHVVTNAAPAGSTAAPAGDRMVLPIDGSGAELASAIPVTPGVAQPTSDASRAGRLLPAPTTGRAAQPARGTNASLLASAGGASDAGYEVASREHMHRAEALVAVVATMASDPMMDSLTGRWARDVLTNTRLLLDSPAGQDPVRRRLLEDLETLLVQLVQRSGHRAEERELIDRTLERTQLLTRLRSGASGT